MTNEQMVAGRFLRTHRARVLIAGIIGALNSGRIVQVATCTKATQYDARHADMFKATKSGAYVRRGKSWDCIDYATIRVYREAV